jgi:adenylyl cyclase-associated protein
MAGRGPQKIKRGINWILDGYENTPDLAITEEEADLKVGIMMDTCKASTLRIHPKVKSVLISGCQNCTVACNDVVSVVEMVNCKRVQFHATGNVPTLQIDGSTECGIHLTNEVKATI